jgi:3-dehydroquinate dehydratase-1
MHAPKPIQLNGQAIAAGKLPLICTPLVGRTPGQLLTELAVVLPKKPDVLEWRVDFFDAIGDSAAVIAMASAIKQAAGPIPILFTRRSTLEGGEPIPLTEDQVIALYTALCQSRHIDLIDYEMANDPTHIAQVKQAAQAHGITLILSFHNFSATPTLDTLLAKFLQAEQLGADVAKVAVMPKDMGDVLSLLTATQQASQQLQIPLISMSMGPLGAVSRLVGGVFGSALSFAVGAASSAPGQVPIEDLSSVLGILRKLKTP